MLSLADLIIEKQDKVSQLNWDDKFYILKLHNINRRYNIMAKKTKKSPEKPFPNVILPMPNPDKKFDERWFDGRNLLNFPHSFNANTMQLLCEHKHFRCLTDVYYLKTSVLWPNQLC